MDDLISRAVALDAIDGMKPMQGNMEQLAMKALCWAAVKSIPAVDAVPVVRCRDCKYFEVKDYWAGFGKVPILVSDVPTCHRWGDGECKTNPDGYCFLSERRDGEG